MRNKKGRFTNISTEVKRAFYVRFRLSRFCYLLKVGFTVAVLLIVPSMAVLSHIEKGKWSFSNAVIEFPVIETVQAVETEPEWMTAEFSAYTASVDETDASPLIMASGKMVYLGAVACPRSVPLGSVIELKNGKRYTCEDRMHVRYTKHFDIFMLTKDEAFSFGRMMLEYRLLGSI
jgi:3D (Asp-Asp-Asp) domain-containing protein